MTGHRRRLPSSAGSSCDAALDRACAAEKSPVFLCAECAGKNQHALKAAGCSNDAIANWCAGVAPPPAPCPGGFCGATCDRTGPGSRHGCAAVSPQFPGSRLITAAWGAMLNAWADKKGQVWSLCCSTFEGCDTAAKFHAGCDSHNTTLTVAHNAGGTDKYGKSSNPGNFTFGGFVRSPPRPAEACISTVF